MKEQLPGFVLAELFGSSLVNIDDGFKHELPAENTSKPKKVYLGNYEKKIIVLVNDENNMYMSNENLTFLTGMLNACKLNIAHIALINLKKNPVDFIGLKKDMNPAFLLLFGINALQIELPFDMPHYQVQQYSNCSIATAPSLTDLNKQTTEAKTAKANLWKSLQKMFNLEK